MKVGVDLRPVLSRPTGVGIWLFHLLKALKGKRENLSFVYFSCSLKERFPASKLRELPEGKLVDRRLPVRLINYLLLRWGLPSFELLTGEKVDVVFSPTPVVMPSRRARKIVTVHDLFFYEYPEKVSREFGVYYRERVRASLREADRIIAVSSYTARKIATLLGFEGKIRVIPEAARPFPPPEPVEGLPEEFLLFMGGCEPRKNLATLLRALRLLKDPPALVVVGSASACNGSSGVVWLGYVSDAQLHYLYKKALALVVPSLDEGFGLPVLEAMSLGVPVLCSSWGALREVAQEAALYFHPLSPQQIAETIENFLSSPALREELVQKGKRRVAAFSWDRSAELFLKVLGELR